MTRLIPYEEFLLRRLQQAQRLAASAGAATASAEHAVVPLVRAAGQPRLVAAPEGAQI